MKTLIAVPCMDMMHHGFVSSLLRLVKGPDVDAVLKPNSLIYDSRNMISLTAIERGFDRVMWIDSDMAFTSDAMQILIADMEGKDWKTGEYIDREKDFVTGIYFKRKTPITPVLYKHIEEPDIGPDGKPIRHIEDYLDYPKDSIFPVKGCGFGFCMTSTKLLKEVWEKFGPAFSPYPWAGEDISFCYRVNQLGHTIWCDSRVSCGHIGTYIFTERDYEETKKRGDANEQTEGR